MPRLRDVQEGVRLAVLGRTRPEIIAAIQEEAGLAEARLKIHINNVHLSLTAALKANFPVVCRVVDERFFDYAAHDFIATHPPTSPCLSEYGAALPGFLERFEPARGLPYLGDLARLEWGLLEAAQAEDAPSIDTALLRRIAVADYPNLTLRLDPSMRLLRSPWPVDAIWSAHQGGDPEGPIALHSGGASLCIRRGANGPGFETLEPAPFAFLAALLAGRRLAEAGAEGLAVDPFFDMATALRQLFAEGAVTGFSVLPPPAEES
jgi:hypothetical protein